MSRSQVATFKVAKQASKGTAATTGFHCGLMKVSGFSPKFEVAENGIEHGCAAGSDVYRDKSQRVRTYYTVPGQAEANLYPNMIGVMFLGLGMTDSVSGTIAKTHVITAATSANDPYLTVLHNLAADVGADMERRSVDQRVTQLKLTADQNGVMWSSQFTGLTEGASLGTETKTDEVAYKLLRGVGTFTLSFDPGGTPVTISSNASNPPRSLEMTIDNPIATDDYALWSSALASLPRTEGIRIEGKFGSLPVQYSVMKQLMYGGASGTAPSSTWKPCSIDFKFATAEEITTGIPYSLQITIPRAEVWIDEAGFVAKNGDIVRWDFPWRAYAGTASPFTATLINTVTAY